jgi:hypothetical protein
MSKMADAYRSGQSLLTIAKRWGIASETVRRKLRIEGVKMRPRYSRGKRRPSMVYAELPSVGVCPAVLYYQGNCLTCHIPMYAWSEVTRQLCGYCLK